MVPGAQTERHLLGNLRRLHQQLIFKLENISHFNSLKPNNSHSYMIQFLFYFSIGLKKKCFFHLISIYYFSLPKNRFFICTSLYFCKHLIFISIYCSLIENAQRYSELYFIWYMYIYGGGLFFYFFLNTPVQVERRVV